MSELTVMFLDAEKGRNLVKIFSLRSTIGMPWSATAQLCLKPAYYRPYANNELSRISTAKPEKSEKIAYHAFDVLHCAALLFCAHTTKNFLQYRTLAADLLPKLMSSAASA